LIRIQNARLEAWCRGLLEYAATLSQEGWLGHNRLRESAMQKFRDGVGTVRLAKCFRPCPLCQGDGCSKCCDTGMVPHHVYQKMV
jgi:hypothetical protein